jgi:cytoskeletal protein CcmA (bactofilin family)
MFTNNNNTVKKTVSSAAVNMIGNGTVIIGEIKSKGDIRVDGSLNGSIETEGKVVVGQEGVVEGDVICKDADIAGVLKAKITVSQLLSLKSSAKLHGDIITNKLSIEPGATFTGSCSMGAVIKDIKDIKDGGTTEKREKTA